ncbi:hypothetical protein FRAHR75_20087 [Frankia sp. Hr75.2]|nr:hypothetical protein FRAHR75_20087 [Frankia sp. Hr75.2]
MDHGDRRGPGRRRPGLRAGAGGAGPDDRGRGRRAPGGSRHRTRGHRLGERVGRFGALPGQCGRHIREPDDRPSRAGSRSRGLAADVPGRRLHLRPRATVPWPSAPDAAGGTRAEAMVDVPPGQRARQALAGPGHRPELTLENVAHEIAGGGQPSSRAMSHTPQVRVRGTASIGEAPPAGRRRLVAFPLNPDSFYPAEIRQAFLTRYATGRGAGVTGDGIVITVG